jgi:Ran GTPase-activating protein (RanGAP) involved in mRNA processing and transport
MSSLPTWLQDVCTQLASDDAQLTNLNLNIRRLDARMMEALAAALQRNTVLLILNLTSSLANSSNVTAVQPLALTVLARRTSLKILHLSYNRLTDVAAIGDALATNPCLQELYLDYNSITAESAKHLANGLRHNTALGVLQLNYNCIEDEGATALASALLTNKSLQVLGLDRNGITETGSSALLAAVQTNNAYIQSILLQQDDGITRTQLILQLYCRANQAGRRYIRGESLPLDHWPALLERIKDQPDLLYFFLDQKPDLCQHAGDRTTYYN